MRIVHRIIQSLAFAPALVVIGIVPPAASLAQAVTFDLSPWPATAGQRVIITVHFAGDCAGGHLAFGDGTPDGPLGFGSAKMNVVVQHVYAAAGVYRLRTYYVSGKSTAANPELSAKYTAACKGGPVGLQVTAPKTPSANSAPPAPGAPPNSNGVIPSVTCKDGIVVANQGATPCANHGGVKHGNFTPSPPAAPPNTPNAPPPAPNANTTGTARTCNDGTVINNQGAHVCDNHGGFKPTPPPPPNTTATGVTCNDGTVSNTQGKGACKDHHGILRPLPQPCNDGTMSNNTADNACDTHGGFKKSTGTPNTPPAPPPAPNTNTTGATCNDGTTSTSTGKGACAHHGGVKRDSTPNATPAPPAR